MRIKKGMRVLSLLMVLALLGAIFVPAVSALTPEKLIIDEQVDLDTAYNAAVASFSLYTHRGIGSEELKIWGGASIKKEDSLKVYDVSKNLQYYEFDIVKNGIVIGEIRASANKLLGVPVLTIEYQANNLKEKIFKSIEEFDKKGIETTIVSYISGQGLLVENDSDPKYKNYIYDVYWNRKIPLSEVKSCYEVDEKEGEELISHWNELYISEQKLSKESVKLTKSESRQDYYYLSGMTLYGQSYPNWCGVASAQMVADFHGNYESQTSIANYMGINTTGGCTFNDQYRYFYFHLNYNHYSDYGNIPFDDIKDAIGNDYSPGYPVIDEVLLSGYHDRVAAGWEEYTGGTKKLKIYDPANGGSIYTESFVDNHPFAAFTYP